MSVGVVVRKIFFYYLCFRCLWFSFHQSFFFYFFLPRKWREKKFANSNILILVKSFARNQMKWNGIVYLLESPTNSNQMTLTIEQQSHFYHKNSPFFSVCKMEKNSVRLLIWLHFYFHIKFMICVCCSYTQNPNKCEDEPVYVNVCISNFSQNGRS